MKIDENNIIKMLPFHTILKQKVRTETPILVIVVTIAGSEKPFFLENYSKRKILLNDTPQLSWFLFFGALDCEYLASVHEVQRNLSLAKTHSLHLTRRYFNYWSRKAVEQSWLFIIFPNRFGAMHDTHIKVYIRREVNLIHQVQHWHGIYFHDKHIPSHTFTFKQWNRKRLPLCCTRKKINI